MAGWVDFGAGVPGAFQLTFRDPKKKVLADSGARIGAGVVLAPVADGKGAQSPLITGEVTGLESDYDGTGTFTVIRGYDLGHRMLRQRRVLAHTKVTASDIARKLATQDRVPVGTIGRTRTVYDFISQANITDWDFLGRLAEENEMVMSVDSKGKFQFVTADRASGAPPVSTPSDKSVFVLEAGVDILRCRAAVTSADQVSRVDVRGWDVTKKRDLKEGSPAASNPGIEIGTTPAKAVSAFGAATLVETDIPYDSAPQAKKGRRRAGRRVTAAFAELEVTVRGNPQLRPGVPVALVDVGEPFAGKYTVTAARHTFGDGRHDETFLTVSGRQWRSLYGLASGRGAGGQARLPGVAERGGHGHQRPQEARPGQAAVPLARRPVRQRLDPHRSVRRGGRRRSDRPGRQGRGAGGLRPRRLGPPLRHRRSLQRQGPSRHGGRPAGRPHPGQDRAPHSGRPQR